MTNEEGKRLQQFMEQEGITQEELGKLLGKSQSVVSRYLSGKHELPLPALKTLYLTYGLRYEYLLHNIGPARLTGNQLTDVVSNSALQEALQEAQAALNKVSTLANRAAQKNGVKPDVKTSKSAVSTHGKTS